MIIHEELIQFIWANQLFNHQNLHTTTGEVVHVLAPGTWNRKGSGPDFQNARIRIGNTAFAGAVEIHVRAKEWEQHGHQNDLAYNAVILHVVLDGATQVIRQDGSPIPTLCLKPYVSDRLLLKYFDLVNSDRQLPCSARFNQLKPIQIKECMDRMSVERLQSKVRITRSMFEMLDQNWNALLCTQIIRSYGLPSNSDAFLELSQKLPLELLWKLNTDIHKLEALFLGLSGLLAEPYSDDYQQKLGEEYQFLKRKHKLTEISCLLKRGSMRPASLPTIKLAQLASLFHHRATLVQSILEIPDMNVLVDLLRTELGPYWNNHYVFGKESKPVSKKLSRKGAELVIINAIVPVLFFLFPNSWNGRVGRFCSRPTSNHPKQNPITSFLYGMS